MSEVEKKYQKNSFVTNLINGSLTIIFSVIAFFLRTDYGFAGILMIAASICSVVVNYFYHSGTFLLRYISEIYQYSCNFSDDSNFLLQWQKGQKYKICILHLLPRTSVDFGID